MPMKRENAVGPHLLHEAVGKLLFLLVGVSRTIGGNPEDALREVCEQFQMSFSPLPLDLESRSQ